MVDIIEWIVAGGSAFGAGCFGFGFRGGLAGSGLGHPSMYSRAGWGTYFS